LNWYSYCFNNPLNLVDRDGRIAETPWDAFNVALDATSIVYDIATGDYLGALIDTGCLIGDGLATATPLVPGGLGTIRATTRAATWANKAIDAIRLGNQLDGPMKKALRSQARGIYEKAFGKMAKDVQIHHVIPLEWAHKMGNNFNPNSLGNLAGFESTVHTKITSEWADFKRLYSDPTAKQIQDYATYIMDKYKDYVIN
jgi:hypothetical protein